MHRLVKMARVTPAHPGGPTTADVHPDEVANMCDGGWSILPDQFYGDQDGAADDSNAARKALAGDGASGITEPDASGSAGADNANVAEPKSNKKKP